ARAESEKTGYKLIRAGANRVVHPHQIGGRRMALAALRPTLDRFLSMETLRQKYNVYMEEIHLGEASELCGKTLSEAAISRRFGLTIIAILGKDQTEDDVTFNPGSSTRLNAGDTLIVLGREEQLQRLEKIASGASK
nr:TrkA C-terminal domain-containing protein [bacterium]